MNVLSRTNVATLSTVALGRTAHATRIRQASVMARSKNSQSSNTDQMSGIVFKPMEEVQMQFQKSSDIVAKGNPAESLSKINFSQKAEASVNEQINVELNMSYIYHSMSCYFDRDSVALPGIAKFFRQESLEERTHAQRLMDFLNTRGGRVKFLPIIAPESEFDNEERGDALYAFELALSLEKLNYDKLSLLWEMMEKEADPQAVHFVEYMLEQQAADIKQMADYVTQLRRVGKGHGVWHWDKQMYDGEPSYTAYAGPDSG